MFKWNYGRFMPFYAPDSGADGGQAGGEGNNGGEQTPPDTTDYKALYEKAQADNKKLKASFDQTAHEVAELKKAQKAKMSEEEQRAADNAEKEQRYKELQNEVYEMRVSTAFAKSGFDEKDYGDIAKKIVEVGGEQSNDLAETLIAFVKKANQSAVASARNGAIKDGAVPPKTSTAKPEENSIAKQVFEANKPNANSENIKNRYK